MKMRIAKTVRMWLRRRRVEIERLLAEIDRAAYRTAWRRAQRRSKSTIREEDHNEVT